jgi:hypothetical protein
MILAALLTAAQLVPVLEPQIASQAFLSICFRDLARPEAVRRAIRRSPLGFARAADEHGFEIYRAPAARIMFRPGEGCELQAGLPARADGEAVIARVSDAAGLPMPHGSVNRPGTAARYQWPRPPQAGRIGLNAVLDYGRGWGAAERPVRLTLWAYLANGREQE